MPLPDDASPVALSPGYIDDSDQEEDPEEDPADYPADGGDDADDESSDDDDDDEEEEHLAPADSTTIPTVDPVPSAEDTEAFETDESAATPPPPPAYSTTSRMSVQSQTPIPFPSEAEVARLLALPTPPPYPLTPLSSLLPQIRLPLPSPPTTSPTYVEAPLGYRAVGIRLRVVSPPTHHPSKIPSPPLLLPSTTHRDDLPEADMSLQKRARFTAPTGRFEIGESSLAAAARHAGNTLAHRVDYGFMNTVDASICAVESREMTAVGEVNDRVTDLATTQRPLLPETYGLTLRAGSRPWRPRLELCRGTSMFRDLVRAAEAGPQDGPEDAGSSC
ncbi:hypothetical protein Tco_1067958 [Tanacetum coccineum]|uniref:Uncharacterized protein n=1 Tax=Tanacetum coccineum TaxID=301880 RepID=A0ABQ5HED0_9ASTR